MISLTPGESTRILLVSTRQETRDEIGAALAERAGDHRLYWVSQPELAAVRAGDLLPHAILVDDALGEASMAALVGQLASRTPGAAILALVAEDALAAARGAVLAGARGFVARPVKADELVGALVQVLARRASTAASPAVERAGRVVAFCAPKGGTGRTTLAINTAISLRAETGQSVALIDADYAAPAVDVALNLNTDLSIADLLPKLSRLDEDLVAGVMADHVSGVEVLLAPPPADLTSPISLPHVQQVLSWLRRMYDWVVVDLGLPMDETAFAFLDGADRILMTVLPEMIGLRNTRLMLDQLAERGYPAGRVWLVLNRYSLKGGVSVGDIEERLRVRVAHRVPDDQSLVTYSVNRGVPLSLSHPRSAVARGVRALAARLAKEGPNGAPAEPAGGGRGPLGWLRLGG